VGGWNNFVEKTAESGTVHKEFIKFRLGGMHLIGLKTANNNGEDDWLGVERGRFANRQLLIFLFLCGEFFFFE